MYRVAVDGVHVTLTPMSDICFLIRSYTTYLFVIVKYTIADKRACAYNVLTSCQSLYISIDLKYILY